MKALLALVLIYVAIFFVAIQGSSQGPVHASQSAVQEQAPASIDPGKQANIRSLMELIGVRDIILDAAAKGTEQFRENLSASVPNSDRGQQFVNAFVQNYQKRLNPDDVTNELVTIYDKHFTDEDVNGLLQFYGSPVGQKYAAEMPKITVEIQAANRAIGTRVAKEVLQDLRQQYPGLGAQARLRPRAQQPEQAKPKQAGQAEFQASSLQP